MVPEERTIKGRRKGVMRGGSRKHKGGGGEDSKSARTSVSFAVCRQLGHNGDKALFRSISED